MINICIVTNPQSAATDFYRSVGPLYYIQKATNGVVQLDRIQPNQAAWHDFSCNDIVFFSRPNGKDLLSIIAEVKDMGKKVWVDYDDLLDELSDYNPAKVHFGREDVKESVRTIMSIADVVTVSTQHLKEAYQPIAENEIIVIKNAYDNHKFKFSPLRPQSDPIRLHWRGSATHLNDLSTIRYPINWLTTNRKWSVKFHGLQKWMMYGLDYPATIFQKDVLDFVRQNPTFQSFDKTIEQIIRSYNEYKLGQKIEYQLAEWENQLFRYFRKLVEDRIDWLIFPLVDDPFNQSKSNISAIEALTAGAAVLAPSGFPEFIMPGIVNYDSPEHLHEILNDIENGLIDKTDHVMKGRQWLKEFLNVDNENDKRMDVIGQLTGVRFTKKETV